MSEAVKHSVANLEVVSLQPLFAAEVRGLDLRKPLANAEVEAIENAISHYAVLLFRDQLIDDDEHAQFTRNFGPIDAGLTLANAPRKQRLNNTDVIDLANMDADGNVYPPDHARNVSLVANQMWHSDSSFKSPPAKYSVLCGIDVPSKGGETEFADQRAAYDALDDQMKSELEGLVAEHWAFHSRNLLGNGGYTPAGIEQLPAVDWPLVQTVPESGRKTLFLGVHTREIRGWATAPARMYLMDLLEHATQREFVYRHTWRNGDVLMWDNRCTLHRGRRYDLAAKREIRRCTVELD
jgi:alpha-ketoglutarate-dependent 2,4-dichlorophenoxyacetate dioxygenase